MAPYQLKELKIEVTNACPLVCIHCSSESTPTDPSHIQTNKCLQLIEAKRPKLRDTLDMLQLNQLMIAEVVAERSIQKHMADGEHYKAIFTLVKQDLEKLAESLMIPNLSYQKRLS